MKLTYKVSAINAADDLVAITLDVATDDEPKPKTWRELGQIQVYFTKDDGKTFQLDQQCELEIKPSTMKPPT